MQSKYQSYSEGSGGGSSDFDDDVKVKVSPYTMLTGDLVRVFGNSPPWGEQSLGVAFEDVALEDGTIYVDPETGNLKTFSWKEVLGLTVEEALDEGVPFGPEEAHDRLSKTYGDTQKTYRLVGAVSEAVGDLDAASRVRHFELSDDGDPDHEFGDVEFDEYADFDGEPIPVAENVIMWHSGSSEYGASTTAKRLAGLLTEEGTDIVVDEDDVSNWLADTSGDNLLRPDLDGRRVRYFITRRSSDESDRSYNYPVVEDAKTGEAVTYSNTDDEGDSGN